MITTLLLMVLLAGFAIAAQNRALSQAKVLDRIINLEEERIALQSARALALPLVGEVLLDGDAGTPVRLRFEGRDFVVRLEPARRAQWYQMAVVQQVD